MDLESSGDPMDMIADQSFENFFGKPRNEKESSESEAVTLAFPGDVSKIDFFESDNQKICKLQKGKFLGGLAEPKLQKKRAGQPMGGKFEPLQAKKRVKTNEVH